MLCPDCHIHTNRDFPVCLKCGVALPGKFSAAQSPSELRAAGSSSGFPLRARCTTIGRGVDNDVQLPDDYVSRSHARIWREPAGYRLEDLDSLNGTAVNGQHLGAGESARVRDLDVVTVGMTNLVIEQPRDENVGWKTIVGAAELPTVAFRPREAGHVDVAGGRISLESRPRRRGGWALKRVASRDGADQYVLRGTDSHAYVRITQRDVFLWNLMDGENTVRDLVFAYSNEYGQLAFERIDQLIGQLRRSNLLVGSRDSARNGPQGFWRGVGRLVLRLLTRAEIVVSGLDGFLDRLYRDGAWRFFTPAGLTLIWGLAVAGLAAFGLDLFRQPLLQVGGAGLLGVAVVVLSYITAVTLHELAHALTVKSYGRRVSRGGLMLTMLMPYAFVDTTDIWLEARAARVMVSIAGPLATLSVASLFSLAVLLVPGRVLPALAMQIAFGLYLNTLFNCNPLLSLDGYRALSDWLEMPRLREEARAYFRKGLWHDLRSRRQLARREAGLAFYGALSIIGTTVLLLLGVLSWNTRIAGLVRQHVPRPLDTAVVVAGLLLLFFPVLYGPVLRAQRRLRRARRRRHDAEDSVHATVTV